jgi:hypothetical protein
VLEQRTCFFEAFCITARLGTQVMLNESFGNPSFSEYTVYEPSPHAVKASTSALFLVIVTFATLVAEQEWRKHRAFRNTCRKLPKCRDHWNCD